MEYLKDRIRSEARRIGFLLCGFAPVAQPPHGDFVQRWLTGGAAAGMDYIQRGLAKRLNPRLILPEARTVVSVACPYLAPPEPTIDWRQQLRGRIAAYAWGTDYHSTVAGKLHALAAYICAAQNGAVAAVHVDTGPVLEREWAALGGLGWFGKNTNLLHTEQGSWFFLGEILTNLELGSDPGHPDRCGTCTRCLDHCPTQALKPGYLLDSRRCISYLTIEHRGAIPVELRAGIGNWIFGCDVCQEVCPWNARRLRRHPVSDAGTLLPYLPDLLVLSEDAFTRRFGHSAIMRARRQGFARNVAVALGNTGNPAAVKVLTRALRRDASALVRAHAAWALGTIGDRSARRALESARPAETEDAVCREIAAALASR